MVTTEKVTVSGLKELQAGLLELDDTLSKRISTAAMRKAMEPTLVESHRQVPHRTGAMAISLKIKKLKAKNKAITKIGVITDSKGMNTDTFYAAFVQFGHKIGSRKLGDSRVDVPAEPFLEDAWNATKGQVLDNLAFQLWVRLEKQAKKLAKAGV